MDAHTDPLHFLPPASRDTSIKRDFAPDGPVNIMLKISWDAPEDDIVTETGEERELRLRNDKLVELGLRKKKKLPGRGERMF